MNVYDDVKIGRLISQNRIVMPPMHTGMASNGHVTDDLVNYYMERAVYSRPGVIITEHSYIDRCGMASETQLSIAEDGMVEEHRRLTIAIHKGGCLAFAQLNHAGSNGVCDPVSASNVCNPKAQELRAPRALDTDEIRGIEKLFETAAIRAVKAGYDGVEIHCAHGYLLNQFYSPITNKRSDEFGGSLENRLRFLLDTLELVKNAVGEKVPVAVRLGGCDYMDGGSTEEDAVKAAVILEKAGTDLLDISGGMCGFIVKGLPEPGYFASMSEKIRKAVSIPVMMTGGVKTPAEAQMLINAGKADLIGIGRALFNDSHCLLETVLQ